MLTGEGKLSHKFRQAFDSIFDGRPIALIGCYGDELFDVRGDRNPKRFNAGSYLRKFAV
jgi:hypothetical protein